MTIDFDNEESCVSDVTIRCSECPRPMYEDLDLEKMYRIIMPSFLGHGGDGFVMLSDNVKNLQIGPVDSDVYIKYLKKMSPIEQLTEGRINVVKENERIKRQAEYYVSN